ncbi:glycosyltransferase [Coriobacteriia bacterium Es71-Z0120]|uniref:glycosyltransferase n=1 Tax=Parvivirga hydrogeniphila TaxID=2939460 RepID=UPI002260E740|nr:glycosyltransferase [Parvivirga hydrogeniphila]MCL4078790.1 glycosyltransferase [Parvivirga hydrogeniphila]
MSGDRTSRESRLRGVLLSKSFPNPAEPIRGLFVEEQMRATADAVVWSVVAPVPYVPKVLARIFDEPYIKGSGSIDGASVRYPRYPVVPRRLAHRLVPGAIARTADKAFRAAKMEVDAQFVHAHELFTGGGAARRLCARTGLPFVVTAHGQDLYSNLRRPAWHREVEQAVRAAAAVVCVSRRLADDAVRLVGADPAKVVVVPNTYDTGRFRFVERSRAGAPRFVAVGRLVPEKGHDVLLDAFASVASAIDGARLTIVGDGVKRAALEARARELGLEASVRFAGALAGRALAAELANADVFVLPSRSEGFGVVLVEAMATGLPVVATRCGGPEDIVTPRAGILVEAGDAEDLAHGMREAVERLDAFDGAEIARSAAERFSPAAVAARLVRVYEDVIAGRAPRDAIGGER